MKLVHITFVFKTHSCMHAYLCTYNQNMTEEEYAMHRLAEIKMNGFVQNVTFGLHSTKI